MVLLNQENRLLTGSADSELRAWDIQYIEEVKRYHSCWVTVYVGWITFQHSLECDLWSCVENWHWSHFNVFRITSKVSSQCKEVGEPQEKKVRTLLMDEEEDEEGLDEEPEEVIFLLSCSPYSVHVFSGCQWLDMTLDSLKGFSSYVYQRSAFCLQRIVSCKKVGSVLREARDRVVSLVTDAKANVLACHVSIFHSKFHSYAIIRHKCTFYSSSFLFKLSHESVHLKQKPITDSYVVLGCLDYFSEYACSDCA